MQMQRTRILSRATTKTHSHTFSISFSSFRILILIVIIHHNLQSLRLHSTAGRAIEWYNFITIHWILVISSYSFPWTWSIFIGGMSFSLRFVVMMIEYIEVDFFPSKFWLFGRIKCEKSFKPECLCSFI